ncbi:hypothetical protein BV898_13911 [Hypsibius exemplaris]|uniref:Uncharacterized protein n=1 Tax=Hypsibius exemplaris TaxID=2072580 RepID=A0A1W0W9B1_HYPEX|nr:hypothetical protein BV898_13911 [Hypsibius exemplaris]
MLFVTDVLRLVCIVGDALSPQDSTPQRIRLAASVLLCLSSFFINVGGLISLMDSERETRALLHKLQSCWAEDSAQSVSLLTDANVNNVCPPWCKAVHQSDDQVSTILSAFESSCFGSRKATIAWGGLGYLGRGTVINVFGWLLTFYVFLLSQH